MMAAERDPFALCLTLGCGAPSRPHGLFCVACARSFDVAPVEVTVERNDLGGFRRALAHLRETTA